MAQYIHTILISFFSLSLWAQEPGNCGLDIHFQVMKVTLNENEESRPIIWHQYINIREDGKGGRKGTILVPNKDKKMIFPFAIFDGTFDLANKKLDIPFQDLQFKDIRISRQNQLLRIEVSKENFEFSPSRSQYVFKSGLVLKAWGIEVYSDEEEIVLKGVVEILEEEVILTNPC